MAVKKPVRKNIYQIVLTGGPCAGKSTFVSSCKRLLEEKGVKTITMPEVATEIMASGIKYGDIPNLSFQQFVIEKMLTNEKYACIAAESYAKQGPDVVIFYDRGLCDNKAYCSAEEWRRLLKAKNLSDEKLRHRYDAVFNIVTTAYGAEDVWDTLHDNNPQRFERSVEQARETEDRTQAAWAGHFNLKIFGNDESGWEGKEKRMFDAVFSIIGLMPPLRISARYLVDFTAGLEGFTSQYDCVVQFIEQHYLKPEDPGVERRLRRIQNEKYENDVAYYYTERENEGLNVITRREHMLRTEREYARLITQADSSKVKITKTRYAFTANNQHLVLDVYPKDKHPQLRGKALLELRDMEKTEQDFIAPRGLSIFKNVTDDSNYYNSSLAAR
jgi:predicted ATPase/CYTH domain-containing protein